MQTAGGGFAAAVTSSDQLVDYKVTVGFPASVPSYKCDLTKCVVSVAIDRAVTTTLPDGTTLISGYPSAAMTVVLAGMLNQAPGVALVEADNAFRLFNPNDSSSLMWRTTCGGLTITAQAGLWDGGSAADLVTQYTGTIDQVTCSNGVVTLVCRDQRSTVTSQATLPPVITNSPYNSGLTSEYAVDYLLRHSSPARYYSWPALRSSCVLAVGFKSSIWADVGTLASRLLQPTPSFIPGVNGSALAQQTFTIPYIPTAPFVPADKICGQMLSVADSTNGLTVFIGDDAGTYQLVFSRNVGIGKIVMYTISPSGTSTLTQVATCGAGNRELEFSASWASGSSTVSGTVWVDGTSTGFSFSALDTRPSGENFTLVNAQGPIEGLQLTKEASYATGYPFVPTLDLDQSLNPLTALPDVSGKDTWSVLQDIAAAEAGVIGFDELGVCRFVNRNTIRSMSVARSITSTNSLMTLDSLAQMSLCATHVQAPVNQLQISTPQTVWSATSVLQVNPASPLTFIAQTAGPVLSLAATDSGFVPNAGPTPGLTYWQACYSADGSGAPAIYGISVSIVQLSATQLSVTVTNNTGFVLWLCTPAGYFGTAGAPALFIGGQLVTNTTVAADGSSIPSVVIADSQWPSITAGGAVTNTEFGEILLALSANDWLQDVTAGQTLADYLIKDLHYPKPLYRNVSIVADPRLQLLDRVTLVDSDVSKINDDAQLVGISTRFSAGEWVQTVDARAMFRPGAWILGVAGRSELGLTTFLY